MKKISSSNEATKTDDKFTNTTQNILSSEGTSNAKSKKCPGRPSIDARREGNNVNGCKPFLAQANRLLEKKRGSIADTTVAESGRKYKMLNAWLTDLKREGKIATTSPDLISEEDVRSIMEFLRVRAPDLGYRANLVGLIEQVLISADNATIGKMRNEGYRFPKAPLKPIRALSETNLEALQAATRTMEGWRGDIARFMVWIYPYTGLRLSELRLAHLEDLDTKEWKFFVRYPKGLEAGYGIPQWIAILPPARPLCFRIPGRKEGLPGVQRTASELMATHPKHPHRRGQGAFKQQFPGHQEEDRGTCRDGLQAERLPVDMRPDDQRPQ